MLEILLGVSIGSGMLALGMYTYKYLYLYKPTKIKLIVSQSRSHEALASNMILIPMRKPLGETQSSKYEDKTQVRVLINENSAYWIVDNSVYRASIDEDGYVQKDSAEIVDMMSMNKIQLDEMMFIVEKLTEGKNDNRTTGN